MHDSLTHCHFWNLPPPCEANELIYLSYCDRRVVSGADGESFVFGERHSPLRVDDDANSRRIADIGNVRVLVDVDNQS